MASGVGILSRVTIVSLNGMARANDIYRWPLHNMARSIHLSALFWHCTVCCDVDLTLAAGVCLGHGDLKWNAFVLQLKIVNCSNRQYFKTMSLISEHGRLEILWRIWYIRTFSGNNWLNWQDCVGLVLVWTPLYGRDHLHLMPGPANLIQDGNWSLGSVLGQTSNASQPAPSHCYQVRSFKA